MKPTLAILILACWLIPQPLPLRDRAPWERPGYVEPQWATELRELLNQAIREDEARRVKEFGS